jgi:hypothetical protein
MSAELLASYGMRQVGIVAIIDDRFVIDLADPATADLTCCIYAFLIGTEILRIGSSKAPLGSRFRAWQRDVTAALQGIAWRTPASEAEGWRTRLPPSAVGTLWAREGTMIDTPIGKINAYLSEESALIGWHLPALNNSKHR